MNDTFIKTGKGNSEDEKTQNSFEKDKTTVYQLKVKKKIFTMLKRKIGIQNF